MRSFHSYKPPCPLLPKALLSQDISSFRLSCNHVKDFTNRGAIFDFENFTLVRPARSRKDFEI